MKRAAATPGGGPAQASSGGAQITGAGIRELASLPNLQDLSLIRSAIDDQALKEVGELKELRKLNLRKTTVSDEGLKQLASMNK